MRDLGIAGLPAGPGVRAHHRSGDETAGAARRSRRAPVPGAGTEPAVGRRPDLREDPRRLGVRRVHHRRVLPVHRRLAGVALAACRPGHRRARDGGPQPGRRRARWPGPSQRPWRAGRTQPVVATPRSWRCAMATMRERQREVQLYRGQVPSPGRPTVAWRRGPGPVLGGDRSRGDDRGRGGRGGRVIPGWVPVVPSRWRREPLSVRRRCRAATCRSPSARTSRCCERRGSACARSPAGWAGRPSTISRELRRNASTRTWRLEYKASIAQWHAERRARRPKAAKLATNERLRDYVQDRLSGVVRAPDGRVGRARRARRGRAGTSRTAAIAGGCRRGAPSRSRKRLQVDFPDDESMRISHEAIYQALYVAGPRRAQARAGRLPAHRPGAAGPASPGPAEGLGARHARGDDQRTSRRGRGPSRSRPLGRRPAHRAGALRDRHARRAHDPLHDAGPPATRGRLRRHPTHEERARARRLRRGHDEERARRRR